MRRVLCGPLILLSACSSGGSGGGGTPAPAPNAAPSFTSAATASVVENSTLAYQATASDPENNPVTFSIAGGADAGRFTITAAGALGFAANPNFELPADADGNNVYLVQLRASDGTASTTLDLQVTVTNSREGIAVRRVGSGFDQPIFVAPIPGDSRVFVPEKTGKIWLLDPATGSKSLVTTVANLSTDGERGLLGMAVPTAAAARGLVKVGSATGPFFVYATAADGTIEVRYYQRDPVGNYTYQVALSVPHPGFSNHNGGWIDFGPDGNLYIAVGDGGGAGDPGNNAQNPNSRLGKILRLAADPDPYAGAAINYFIAPPGNPFLAGGGDRWVWALGLRNPFRNSFAPDGRLVIGDVGQDALEELDLARTNQPGLNFGWPFLEGTQPYRGTAPAGLVDPVSQYGHGTGPRQGNSLIGGYVYRGAVTSLQGLYVFGDFVSGNLWTLPYASLAQGSLFPAGNYERRNADFAPDVGAIDQLVSFGEDSAGNLYIVDIAGEVFEVVPG